MDTKKITLIGAIVLFVIALSGALFLTYKGVTVPAWLAVILTGLGWLVKSPLTPADNKDSV